MIIFVVVKPNILLLDRYDVPDSFTSVIPTYPFYIS